MTRQVQTDFHDGGPLSGLQRYLPIRRFPTHRVLKGEKLVLDWRKEQRTRAAVRVTVEETLDRLPEK